MAKQRSGLLLGGFLVGAAVGTVAGLLYAPRAGRETRQLLKKSADTLPELAEDLSTSLQFQADRLSESAVHQWEGTLARLSEAIRAGVEAANAQRLAIQSQRQDSQDRTR
ncbi:YtxH domain-containing protein [Altericista sp. CCNU0014]|uniref:YtxH domain-containing protein n=1 Tax=Altericista sp. CCNU0014 TaxID=3082949 RepID=UPI00384BCA72